MLEKIGDLELGDGLPEGKLQVSFYGIYKVVGSFDQKVVSLRECRRGAYRIPRKEERRFSLIRILLM